MKQTETQVVFYNAEKDEFLKEYKDRGTLAFEAGLTTNLIDALSVPLEAYEEQKTVLTSLLRRLIAKCLMWKLNTTQLNLTVRTSNARSVKDSRKMISKHS